MSHETAPGPPDPQHAQRSVKVPASEVERMRAARQALYKAGRDRVSPELREAWDREATLQHGLTLGGVIAIALDMLEKELRGVNGP